jgi:hypothetical protein
MACLLDDGTVLTTLHSIFDFETRQYIDLSDTTITFLFNNRLFTYSIKEPIHDGLTALAYNYHQFEYARLRLNGNPNRDLEGGLQLDTANHWSSTNSMEPSQTRAISGPLVSRVENKLIVRQFTSLSANAAAQSGHYMFAQEGDHPTLPGFSGQAILYPDNAVLYAMHSYLESNTGKRIGIKISEYLLTQKLIQEGPGNRATPVDQQRINDIILHIQRERLRRNGADIKDVTTFLNLVSSGEIPLEEIPQSLTMRVVDSHQEQHLPGPGYRKRKAYFHELFGKTGDSDVINALANCVNKLVSEYYQHHMKTPNALENINIRRSSKVVIELDVNIGIDVKAGNQPTNLVLIDGFGGSNYHIYPVTPLSLARGVKPIFINARQIIAEAAERREKTRTNIYAIRNQ